MSIQTKHNPNDVNNGLCGAICHGLLNHDNIEAVDSYEDIIHVFGNWSHKNLCLIRNLRSKQIPVIFSALKGLSCLLSDTGNTTRNINILCTIRNIAATGAIIHVCGPVEYNIIKKTAKTANVKIISNAMLTSSTSMPSMVNSFAKLYTTAYYENDENIKASIHDTVSQYGIHDNNMSEICEKMLYLKHLKRKGVIRRTFLDETTELLRNADYDENVMLQVLEKMKISRFAENAMALMAEESTLTEGFMPITAIEGKTFRKMKELVIDSK